MTAGDSERSSGSDRGSFIPRLAPVEWLVFVSLAIALALTNIYTTLLTGWGTGGSIIAVLTALLLLRLLGREPKGTEQLNLGQTMASAGGSIGFAVSAYAAVRLGDDSFAPAAWQLCLLFFGLGLVGTAFGASIRHLLVAYYFPSGTACAVIQRVVTGSGEAAGRPVRLLAFWGALSAVATLPTQIALGKGANALLGAISLGAIRGHAISLGVTPLLFGTGLVIGPRVASGLLFGGVAGPVIIQLSLADAGVPGQDTGQWVAWIAIALLTLPTFASLCCTYLLRASPTPPAGFAPGKTPVPLLQGRNRAYAAVAGVGLALASIGGALVFAMPWYGTLIGVLVAWPLAVMLGRVTADTDINPAFLAVTLLMTLCALYLSSSFLLLLGAAIIGGTIAEVAVNIMQDYRTGYLLDANPTHQTTVQVVGAGIAVLAAVPFVLLLDAQLGFGPAGKLPAPGPRIYTEIAQALSGGAR